MYITFYGVCYATSITISDSVTYIGDAPIITTSFKVPDGDTNNDGNVNVRDCATIAKALASLLGDLLPTSADFNKDGTVYVRDAAAIAAALAKGEI